MMCEECGIHPATIRLMSIVNGEKVARNLCAYCLADVKKQLPSLDLAGLDGMLASLLAATKKIGEKAQKREELDIACPECGTSYETFQKTGLLGCAQCYDAFRVPLTELLARVHGATHHQGRKPGATQAPISTKIKEQLTVHNLRQQLASAILAEEYELAASLRDQIRELTREEARAHE